MSVEQQHEMVCRLAGQLAQIVVLQQVASTNGWLLERQNPAPLAGRPLALWALHQTAGRGRRAKGWFGDPQHSIALSLEFARDAADAARPLTGLPLAVGVAVVQALATWVPGLGLKWPNDLQRGGRKCAGILIETRLAPNAQERVVIGVGINLLSNDTLRQAVDQPVCGVFDDSPEPPPARATIVAELIRQLVDCWQQFQRDGLASYALRWHDLDVLCNQTVQVTDAGQLLHRGIAQGINSGGALLVATVDGVVEIVAADVSVRPG